MGRLRVRSIKNVLSTSIADRELCHLKWQQTAACDHFVTPSPKTLVQVTKCESLISGKDHGSTTSLSIATLFVVALSSLTHGHPQTSIMVVRTVLIGGGGESGEGQGVVKLRESERREESRLEHTYMRPTDRPTDRRTGTETWTEMETNNSSRPRVKE